MKYIVRWNDHEGNCQELTFNTITGAKTEAAALELVFDGVEVLDSQERRVWPNFERKELDQ